MFKVFNIDEHGELTLNFEELRAVKEFRELISRSKKVRGDYDGRKKKFANEEFIFIYFYTDYRSPYADRDDKERFKLALSETNLLEYEENWIPDKAVREAIDKYNKLQDDATIRILKGMRTSLAYADKLVDFCNRRIEQLFEEMAAADGNAEKFEDAIKLINTQLEQVFKFTDKLPSTITKLEELEERVKREQTKIKKSVGGHEVGERSNPRDFQMKFGSAERS